MSTEPHLQEAEQWKAKNNITKAMEAIQKGLQQAPTDHQLLISACELTQTAENADICLRHANALLVHHSTCWTGYRFAAESHLRLAQHADAESMIEAGLKQFPQEFWLLTTAITIYRDSDKYHKSLEHSQRLLEQHPHSWVGYRSTALDHAALHNLPQAAETIRQGLEIFADEFWIITTAIDIFRRQKKFYRCLDLSRQLIQKHPESWVGYRSTTLDYLALNDRLKAQEIAQEGLQKFPEEFWLRLTASDLARLEGDRQQSLIENLKIIALHPKQEAGYSRSIEDLIELNRLKEAETVANQGLAKIPNSNRLVILQANIYISINRITDCRWLLYTALKNTQHEEEKNSYLEILTTLDKLLETPAEQTSELTDDCDIICIASDEAPYIHEFIFHHLHLGFRNIFIGTNHCYDQTNQVISKISRLHNNVQAVNVDRIIRSFRQQGCYEYLYQFSKTCSPSRYCLLIDIDEFWVANPFPKTIQQFIENQPAFDVFSFPWMHCFNEQLFSKPFEGDLIYKADPHVKSMISKSNRIRRLRVHSPIVAPETPTTRIRIGDRGNRGLQHCLEGLDIFENISFGKENNGLLLHQYSEAMVFHRHQRSSIEYAYRLFKSRADIKDESGGFKNNRDGWISAEEVEMTASERMLSQSMLPRKAIENYHKKLLEFIKSTGIAEILENERNQISDSKIQQKLSEIPLEVIQEQIDLLRRIFSGTAYLNTIETMYGTIKR